MNPGTALSASSIDTGAELSSSEDGITVTVTVGSARGISVREEVTLTASKNGAGSSVMTMSGSPESGAGCMAVAKPGALTTNCSARETLPGNSKRPSLPVCTS